MDKRKLVIGACFVVFAACSTTEQAKVADVKCGFLGSTCSQLKEGGEGQAALRYVSPAAKWTQYKKIMIQPVTFWSDEQSKVAVADQQRMVNFLYGALNEQLSKQFEIVDQDGPDVMKLQVALTARSSVARPGPTRSSAARRPSSSSPTPRPARSWRRPSTVGSAAARCRTPRSGSGATPRT